MISIQKARLSRAALLCALALHMAGASAQFTNPRPMERAADKYFAMLLQSDFGGLERAAVDARAKDLRIDDGQPVLAALYQGAAGCPCANSLNDELWQLRRARLEAWTKQYPESITARVAHASFPVYYGWFARGNNYASSVSSEAWDMFGERVEQGRRALDGLDASAKQDENWYAAMLSVALAQHWSSERFDALYQDAARRHPTYLPIHFNAANYYAPQWYGSRRAYIRFVKRAMDLVGSSIDTELYARMNWSQGTESMFEDGTVNWTLMKNGFEQIVSRYPDTWNLNNFARFACLARDWSTMNKLAKRIGEAPVGQAWFGNTNHYFECRNVARQQE